MAEIILKNNEDLQVAESLPARRSSSDLWLETAKEPAERRSEVLTYLAREIPETLETVVQAELDYGETPALVEALSSLSGGEIDAAAHIKRFSEHRWHINTARGAVLPDVLEPSDFDSSDHTFEARLAIKDPALEETLSLKNVTSLNVVGDYVQRFGMSVHWTPDKKTVAEPFLMIRGSRRV